MPGLQWFVRFFSSIKVLRHGLSATVLTDAAARLSGRKMGLRSLEVRLGTEPSEALCLKRVCETERTTHQTLDAIYSEVTAKHEVATGAWNLRAIWYVLVRWVF